MPYLLKGRDPTFVYDETHSMVGVVDSSGKVNRFEPRVYFANENIFKPVVHTASTFVTLTIQAGAAVTKSRLTSAGAHGLTAAVSTGKYVYVTWATPTTQANGLYVCTVASTDTTGLFIDIDLPYRSGNTTISVASPAVLTTAGHGHSVGDPVRFVSTGTLPTGLATSTNYYVRRVLSSSTFTVSLTPNGAEVVTTAAGSGTHSYFSYYGTPTVACVTQPAVVFSETVEGGMITPQGCLESDMRINQLSDTNNKFVRLEYCGQALYYNYVPSALGFWVKSLAMYYSPTQLQVGISSATGNGGYNGLAAQIVSVPHSASGLLRIQFENAVADSPMSLAGFRATFS